VISSDHSKEFEKAFIKVESEIIDDAGHAPFVEKTALVYEKLRTFLTQ
jgi:pimeloyl-ACP methyl ester carboxylesterase